MLGILGREEYAGFGSTLAKEKLQQRHGIYLSDETLRKWMTEDGLWKAKRQKERFDAAPMPILEFT